MKKLDLNIVMDEKFYGKDVKIVDSAINMLLSAVNRAINKPDTKGMPSTTSNMDVQRKLARIMRILDDNKEGIVELEDDDFDFIYKKFHQSEFPVGRDITPILFEIEKKLDETKNDAAKK